MQISDRVENGINIVDIEGNVDSNTAPQLKQALDDIVDKGGNRLVLNMQTTDYISSAGLRVLLQAAKTLREHNGSIHLCNLNDSVKEVFDISGFSTIFKIYDSLAYALEDL